MGHEITHVLEGTEVYTQLQNALFEYAKTKGEYDSRLEAITKLYEGMEGTDINSELTADLVGDYLFTDSDFISRLSTQNRNVFQRIYDEIKYLLKVATSGSKEARELERVKKVFEEAYRKGGKTSADSRYSISESKEGRSAAVVDNDILSGINTSVWDNETKKQVQKAAADALNGFSGGFTINGIEFIGNKETRREYTRSNYSEALFKKDNGTYLDKMRAASVIDDVLQVSTNWKNDNNLKHPRKDYVDFVRGNTLIASGENTYSATVLAGITKDGKAVFYDVVDVKPEYFEIKKSESSTTVSPDEPANSILEDSDAGNIAQEGQNVNPQFSISDSDAKADRATDDSL